MVLSLDTSGAPLDQVANIPHIDFMIDLSGRFRMLDTRWKVLDRAMNVSSVPAPGDAAFQAFSRFSRRSRSARSGLLKCAIALNRHRWLYELSTALHEYINGDTLSRASDNEPELELIQSHMAQKPVLRGEVGARALRVR